MNIPFSRAPHIEGANASPHSSGAPNAALLIDFDNVTMGIRSDLSKEMKSLLGSDMIKGKVTVQRAYADWRRYPQYIVPLSEASIDLIFAPAYGSNKKNATDIRMAIDGIELVFTRPEIGTYILLTGDSDFSSLVLKLKEYGKYVIGVGIQESSSDILVQNCDEYYSYTSLSGLKKTEQGARTPSDPWSLVERAVAQMARRGDVMRSDRLKQVMLELDPTFDDRGLGFSKFSRFVSEASQKGLIEIRRMENGQFEILSPKGAKKSEDQRRGASQRDQRKPEASRGARARAGTAGTEETEQAAPLAPSGATGQPAALELAYTLLKKAVAELLDEMEADSVRDSDVKRRMLALQHGFHEADLGFSKFSLFLRRAQDDRVVDLHKGEGGNFHVAVGSQEPGPTQGATQPRAGRLRPREDSGRGWGEGGEVPALFEGQIAKRRVDESVDLARLHLPTDRESVVKYLSNSYGGVGKRTAETLVDALGDRLFQVLASEPSKVGEILPPARAERVLAGWTADFERRSARHVRAGEGIETASVATLTIEPQAGEEEEAARPRRGRRTRGGASTGS